MNEALFQRALSDEIVVPAIWSVEMGNGLGLAMRKGRSSETEVATAIHKLSLLRIHIQPSLPMHEIWPVLERMRTDRLTAYDASYLALAESLRIPLATFDTDLAKAAVRLGIAVVGN
jgi:predicted nucleic acid-binding protein